MTLSPDMQRRKNAILNKNKIVTLDICAHHGTPATLKDATGTLWCSSCQQRYDLINWGFAHDWPLVCVGLYAIGNDRDLWEIAAKVGREEAIQALHAGLVGGSDEVSA